MSLFSVLNEVLFGPEACKCEGLWRCVKVCKTKTSDGP